MNAKMLIAAALLSSAAVLPAENLMKNGDFNASTTKIGTECRSNGGAIALFTESDGNRCGKLVLTKINKSGKYEVLSATVWIGGSYKSNKLPGGFVCKPNTTYDFSVDVKGTAYSGSIKMTTWAPGKTLWYGKTAPATLCSFKNTGEWQTVKGSFTTPPDATHAALAMSIWENTRYAPLKNKVGDYILFDNVVIKERKAAAEK